MSTFHARMAEGKRAAQDARNAGLMVGDYRGSVAPRYMLSTTATLAAAVRAFEQELNWIVLEFNDPDCNNIPF